MSNDKFNTRPAAVDTWLRSLPLASIGETSRQLYQALRNVNRQDDIPVKDYFYFLEAIAQPLHLILPELHRHYAGKPLPLSAKRRKVADVYTQLLRQAIEGYQRVISSSVDLGRFGWKKVVTTSVHRIFTYQSLMLCNYRLLYLPLPRGTWQQLHWLYQLIERNDLLDSKATSLSEGDGKTTLENEFRKLLLISLLSPSLFKATELQQIIALLDNWLTHTRIVDSRPESIEHVYAFLLDTDMPPGLITNNINHLNTVLPIRFFDLAPLVQVINRLLAQDESRSDMISLGRDQRIARRTLLLLLNNWGRPSTRDSERRAIAGQAEMAIGMSAIHYLLNEGRPTSSAAISETASSSNSPSPLAINSDSSLSPNSSFNLLGFATHRDDSHDVWETAFFEPTPPPPSWTESIRMKAYTYLPIRIVNVSNRGFCIEIAQNGIEHIQAGELIAIRGKNAQWQLCEIRWMVCPANGTLRAGVKKLCQTVYPAMLHITSRHHQAQPMHALVGEQDLKIILFMPNMLTRLDSKDMLLEYKGEQHRFAYGAAFTDMTFCDARPIEFLDEANASAAATEPVANPAKVTDHFEKVWASI